MLPNDVGRVVVVEELDVAADGSFAVVVRRIVRRNRYESHLYRVDLTTRRSPERLTSGRVRDTWPRLAPDGSSIAFLRSDPDDDDAPNRLVVMSLGSRRLRTVAPPGRRRGFGEIAEFEWSPDGSRIAFSGEVDGETDIHVRDVSGLGPVTRIVHPGSDRNPAWLLRTTP